MSTAMAIAAGWILFLAFPVLPGTLLCRLLDTGERSFAKTIVAGNLFLLLTELLLATIWRRMGQSLPSQQTALLIWLGMVLVVSLIVLVRKKENPWACLRNLSLDRWKILTLLFAGLLLVWHSLQPNLMENSIDYFSHLAHGMAEGKLPAASLEALEMAGSGLLRIHPALFCQRVVPICFFITLYAELFLLGRAVSDTEDRERGAWTIWLVGLVLLLLGDLFGAHWFGLGQAEVWKGNMQGAFLALPVTIAFLLDREKKSLSKKDILCLLLFWLTGSLLSRAALVLLPALLLFFGILRIWKRRKR